MQASNTATRYKATTQAVNQDLIVNDCNGAEDWQRMASDLQ
jgi:hypothetical protein